MPRIIRGKSFYDKPWYGTYRSMMDRCYREKAKNYSRYGGRGIKVCDEWHDIVAFGEWAEANGYRKGLSIDRIDVDGDYEPSNCRWATPKQQANNRRDTPFVTIDGITLSLTEWADFAGLKRSTVSNRYYDGVRGVNLLRRPDDTRFKKGHNRYAPKKNYYVPAEAESPSPKPTDPVPIHDVYYVMTECDVKTGTVKYEPRERIEP